MKYISVTSVKDDDEELFFESSSNILLAIKLKTGTVVDVRAKGPFLSMSPCPYCNANNDRNHIAAKHIDYSCGVYN